MAFSQRREPQEWEWREVEYEQRRRRAKVSARRRGRLRLAAVVVLVAAVLGSALLAARAVSLPVPHARVASVRVNGDTTGNVAAPAMGGVPVWTATVPLCTFIGLNDPGRRLLTQLRQHLGRREVR